MIHPQRERIAAVLGRRQGSGYLLSPRLLLTAAHVAVGSAELSAVVPGGTGRVPCRLVWSRHDDACDAALLIADRDLIDTTAQQRLVDVEWGWTDSLESRPEAETIGFPGVQRTENGGLETEQLVGRLKPGSGLLNGSQVLDSAHGAPRAAPDGGSPWAGLSGAPVFVSGLLAGLVRSDPEGWGHGRVLVTPAATLLADADFGEVVQEFLGRSLVRRRFATSGEREAEDFEQRLRDYIVQRNGVLEVIGLTRSRGGDSSWPLDTGYLSLELRERQQAPIHPSPVPGLPTRDQGQESERGGRRAEQALSGLRRVLVRGSAGSGKTTLLQWLATLAAGRQLPPELASLTDCIPLTLQLRTFARREQLPSPGEFLRLVAAPYADRPGAAGWVTDQLERGRILLLVDGVDEVQAADRARTRRWLTDLITAFPDAAYVVTTRPYAVGEGWLDDHGFTELDMLPMSRADVAAFVERWHTAETRRAPEEAERLAGWRDGLTAALAAKQDLGRLATSPLMCALVCALNRDRRGQLPPRRMELYRSALELLVVRRDRERLITAPDGLDLSEDQHAQLLQTIAYWLADDGATVIDANQAERLLAQILPTMPAITAPPAEVLEHLVVRGGLLRRPTADTVDFIHRTFQDYLAAKSAIEQGKIGALVRNAHDDQWSDILRMAAGHARPYECERLLNDLLHRAETDLPHRNRLTLLAATCLEHATALNPDIRQRVTSAAATLVPPQDDAAAKELATAGPLVLDLLPGPDGLSDTTARAVVITATQIGDDHAIPLLAQYATHPFLQVRSQLAWSWDRFNTQEYGEQVIARLSHHDDLRFVAKSREHLAFLTSIGGRPRVECSGPLGNSDLSLLPLAPLVELRLHENPHDVDLSFIADAPTLEELWIVNCEGALDLGPLTRSRLTGLTLLGNLPKIAIGPIGSVASLRSLRFERSTIPMEAVPDPLPVPSGLERLDIGPNGVQLQGEHGLERCTRLRHFGADRATMPPRRDGVLPTLSGLETLLVEAEDLKALHTFDPLPAVRRLFLGYPTGLAALGELGRVYPGLTELTVLGSTDEVLDPALLSELRNCSVTTHGVTLCSVTALPADHSAGDGTYSWVVP